MACDMFKSFEALWLLKGKCIYFFGSSNVRSLYKDLIWLLEDGRLIPQVHLKTKNELSYANDVRISNGELHPGRDYEEIREYSGDCHILFQFITRLYLPEFIKTIQNLKNKPDVVVISSCLWDLSRWGSDGVEQFKKNIFDTFTFLRKEIPNTRILWTTTLPPSFMCHGGFLTKDIEFIRNMLPWHVVYANKYASDVAKHFEIDVLDFHYQFRFLTSYRTNDGIHWDPKAVRYATNMLLTHLALAWGCELSGSYLLDDTFVKHSQKLNGASKTESGQTTVHY